MSYLQFLKAWFRYLPMNLVLPGLTSWEPLDNPKGGYTVVIGCMNNMPEIAIANVAFIARMKLPNMHRLILVFDVEDKDITCKEKILSVAQGLPVQIMGYSPKQAAVGSFFAWGWVYSWISWTKAIAAAETKYVLVHDLDAMPIDPHLFEDQYQVMRQGDWMFQGARQYVNHYFTPEHGLVRTFEMMVDIERLRKEFSPFDAFNKLKYENGETVVYDTFLDIQTQVGNCHLEHAGDDKLVHPSQLISQYTDFFKRRTTKGFFERYANLPLFPIYNFLGGNPYLLKSITTHLESKQDPSLLFLGKNIDFSGLPSKHWEWLWQQARSLQNAYYGAPNSEIESYIELMNATYNS